jgi:hypothetical protein
MYIKRIILPALTLALVGSVCSAAHAGAPAPQDQIAASFQRLLDHEPSRTAPAVPAGMAADPLRAAVSTVLWGTQPASFHLPANYARVPAQPEPRH